MKCMNRIIEVSDETFECLKKIELMQTIDINSLKSLFPDINSFQFNLFLRESNIVGSESAHNVLQLLIEAETLAKTVSVSNSNMEVIDDQEIYVPEISEEAIPQSNALAVLPGRAIMTRSEQDTIVRSISGGQLYKSPIGKLILDFFE